MKYKVNQEFLKDMQENVARNVVQDVAQNKEDTILNQVTLTLLMKSDSSNTKLC